MTELAKAKNDTAFIEELRQRNIGQEQSLIFDGFFNKLIECFTSEYAVQFLEILVDPQINVTGLKAFLEEAMQTPKQAAATIESVFTQISWSQIEELLTSSCEIEVFSRSKLVIKRITKAEMLATAKEDFLANSEIFQAIQKKGFCERDLVLSLCFDEVTKMVLVNLNQFLPYIYVLIESGSRSLMECGEKYAYHTINSPIQKSDILCLCENLIQAENLIPNNTDPVSFFKEVGLTDAESHSDSALAQEVRELAY